jgi:hypothetical protein
MRTVVVSALMILAAACSGTEIEDFQGAWRLTAVNGEPLPVLGNSTGGEVCVAAVLQINSNRAGSLDRCTEDPSTSAQISRSAAFVASLVDGDEITFSYFGSREPSQDTATLEGDRLIMRFANDVLTFVPLTGDVPGDVCDLAP